MIRIQEVDTSDVEVASILKDLHEATFALAAPMPDFSIGWWWIAYVRTSKGKKPVGFCGLTKASGRATGYLKRAGVLKRYRGKGLQKRLVGVRERKARKLGFQYMVSDTCNVPASSNTLIKCGYRIFLPAYPWALEKSLYWRKAL